MNLKFRGLYPDEIEIRVGNVSQRGATLLLYKNARVDMALLDEVVGPMNWQRDHKEVKGNMYCGVGIYDEKKDEWCWKWDCGTESNTEAEKGESSDSFKRAGFNWGPGRELYTSPVVFIQCETVPDGNRYKLKDRWEFYDTKVSKIEYEDFNGSRRISKLEITRKGSVIFKWQSDTEIREQMTKGETLFATISEKDGLKAMCKQKGVTQRWMLQAIGIDPENPGNMTQAQYGQAMNLLMDLPDAPRD